MSNVENIRKMAKSIFNKKIQVGHDNPEKKREVGERWFDVDGVEWEKKNGYALKNPDGIKRGFGDNCKDCNQLIKRGRDRDTYNRMNRCFGCQINFEVDLKSMKIGENNNKWYFWVKLQEMQRWGSIVDELHDIMLENLGNNLNDMSVPNALANENRQQTMEKNKKLTGV